MWLSPRQLLVICIIGEILGLAVFLKGFFPVRKASEGYATFHGVCDEPLGNGGNKNETATDLDDGREYDAPPIPPVFGRLVIVLIDALRADFIYGGRNKQDMPYMRAVIDGGWTRSFLARAHPPTVTMPRIKALTSGTIPGFIDVILNLDSSSLAEDNIISQMRRHNRSIFFYGDDTWLKLFPGHFKDADGTTSFFVTDYTEVDSNVTRHLLPALSNPDWDTLILHYLGLDHIGHLAGPTSPLVGPKLLEMDAVLRTVREAVLGQDKSLSLPSLIMLCGDHGMSDAGSHGGATASETITPLVFMSSAFHQDKDTATPHPDEAQQIDIAPTLSLLTGLPIPQNSLGQAIPALLEENLSRRQHLRALQLNACQLTHVLDQNIGSFESEKSYLAYQYAHRLHASWLSYGATTTGESLHRKAAAQYTKAMTLMRDRLASSLTRYDLHAMGCGVVLLWQVTFLLCYNASSFCHSARTTSDLKPSVILLIGCCLATFITHMTLCTASGGGTSEMLCAASAQARALFAVLVAVNGVVMALLLSTVAESASNGVLQALKNITCLNWLEIFLLAGTVGQTATLAASSFVEEEHQVWYFLTTSVLLAVAGHAMTSAIGQAPGEKMAAVVTGLALILCRLLRAWNQTGMKWADRPDIGDWFISADNKASVSILTVLSFTVIYLTRCYGRANDYLLLGAFIGAYLYRYATGILILPFGLPSSEKGIYEAWFVYTLVFISLGRYLLAVLAGCLPRRQRGKTDARPPEQPTPNCHLLVDAHLMLVTLQLRPHNSAVAAMQVLLQRCVAGTVLPWLRVKPWAAALVHVWMGKAAFFAQGNSNSLATVDISAGYIGLGSYVEHVAKLLTCLSTYAGPVLWMLGLTVYVADNYTDRYQPASCEVALTLALTTALPLAFYSSLVSFQRYHLFVWSVFSPKLLYMTAYTSVATATVALVLWHPWLAGRGSEIRRTDKAL